MIRSSFRLLLLLALAATGQLTLAASASAQSDDVTGLRAEMIRDIAAVPDSDLDGATKLTGQDSTNRGAMLLFVTHMHEHLGQSVAYARSNGVVPPWSAGG